MGRRIDKGLQADCQIRGIDGFTGQIGAQNDDIPDVQPVTSR
jgi:hypothetical protein